MLRMHKHTTTSVNTHTCSSVVHSSNSNEHIIANSPEGGLIIGPEVLDVGVKYPQQGSSMVTIE